MSSVIQGQTALALEFRDSAALAAFAGGNEAALEARIGLVCTSVQVPLRLVNHPAGSPPPCFAPTAPPNPRMQPTGRRGAGPRSGGALGGAS